LILVTGGTGLVGSHLLFDLCKSGERVRAIKRSNSTIENVKKVFTYYTPNADELLKNVEWVDADLLDVYSLMDAMEGVNQIFHCAAMVSFEAKHEEEMMNINAEGTANMVNAALAKGIKKFCHVSSVATIGVPEKGELANEETFWKSSPENSNYSISKYAAEREVWRASAEGLDVIIVNPSLIIGAGNWQQSSSNMFSKASKGIKFYTDGATGFIDVKDVSALMIVLMKSEIKNERFLLNSENKTFRTFFDTIHREFGKPLPSIKAGKMLSSFAWRAETVRCLLSGESPLITKETARSANKVNRYSNQKIASAFPDFKFISVEQSVKDTCRLFMK
jgi:nucleoside-diphosphate-sugar epimerase